MKKFIFLLMISSVLIIQCSNESETYQRDIKSTEEAAIDEQSDYFSYEFEEETNMIKVETKESETKKIKAVNEVSETKENEVKTVYEKLNENTEEKTDNEITDENEINDIE